jgi:hypothetical protein
MSYQANTVGKKRIFTSFPSQVILISLLLLLVGTGCANGGKAQTMSSATSANPTPAMSTESTASFTLSGGQAASYTLRTLTPTSKLRHGHREFTILLTGAGTSLFIVFYGYQGPGHYTLSNSVNGGDIHIGLQNDTVSWDLLMRPETQCQLVVASDTSEGSSGLDRMRGTFSCPLLYSSSPAHPQQPVMIKNGSFDIAIIVES